MENIGLSELEAQQNIARYGANELKTKHQIPLPLKILRKAYNPLILLLLFSCLVSIMMGEKFDSMIVAIIIFLSLFLDAYQENQAEDAAEKLSQKINLKVSVIRNGEIKKIPVNQLTIDDVVILNTGSLVPADCRVLESDNLSLNESSLTGESLPQEKKINEEILMGAYVVSGAGRARVIRIGRSTSFGKIYASLDRSKPATDFENGLKNFSGLLIRLTVIFSAVLLVGKLWLGHDLILSIMFILALAVGFAPELLPMILTINLSRGALKLSKNGVIVRFLPAIENFGSMDVLCSDKTGTLTEGKIIHELSLNINGQNSDEVCNYACLNSFFQSDYRNPLDEAILRKNSRDWKKEYHKIKEIAYDFYRQRSSVVLEQKNGERILIVKGAIQSVAPRCLNQSQITIDLESLSRQGLKLLGVAFKKVPIKDNYAVEDESEMTFAGLVAFSDPPKKEALKLVNELSALGVKLKILTGDNVLVAQSICQKIGLKIDKVLTGEAIEKMTDGELEKQVETTVLYAQVNPEAKLKIISALRKNGHVVGYLGDGINDAPSLKNSDIGISVDNAADVARESADLILMRKDLEVLRLGVLEGRKTFANIMKYIMMGNSSTFGNMLSLSAASLILPFLPMLPAQVLLNDLLYDFSQILLAKDNVDAQWIVAPYRWNINFIKRFMLVFGSVSSLFDLITFYVLYRFFHASAPLFQTGWFLESIISQMIIVFSIRTMIVPFFRSRVNFWFAGGILGIIVFVSALPFSPLAKYFELVRPSINLFFALSIIIASYLIFNEIAKRFFYKKMGNHIAL